MTHNKHWHTEIDAHDILWLGFDRYKASVNAIDDEVLDELNGLLQDIAQNKQLKGLVIYSMKSSGFIAGADIHVFSKFKERTQAAAFLNKGQVVFARLEALSIPTVAMISGFCMGGGMELALACDYRVATDDDHTRLGLPEILLGFHPGWGGSVRLPKLIGGYHALSQVILPGSALRAAKAKALGLVDDVVPVRQLKRAATYFITHQPPKHKPSWIQSLTCYAWIRRLMAKQMREAVSKKFTKDHYPAPYAVIDLWEKEGQFNDRAYLKEAESAEKLLFDHPTALNLIRVFFLKERLKSFAKAITFKAKHVHVIGAGVMGGDIAAWCALRGIRVTLQDQSHALIAPALGRAHLLYQKTLRKPRLVQAAMDRLIADPKGHGIAKADVIIEAVSERLELKQSIMRDIELRAKKDAIIATNTSSIPLDEINQSMTQKDRLVGIHFFNPVARMELVEVVRGEHTSERVAQQACAFVGQISRLPLPVQSKPGFLVNRVLMPYLYKAMDLLAQKHTPEEIDQAALSFGMMMGPVQLADTVGLDVCLAVAKNLTSAFGGEVPEALEPMVAAGHLGRKSGQGFYRYKQGKPMKKKVQSTAHSAELAKQLMAPLVVEARRCLEEGVVADADLLDAGMIFGTGFAPFRGGPLHDAEKSR